jgi:hypothetical protein
MQSVGNNGSRSHYSNLGCTLCSTARFASICCNLDNISFVVEICERHPEVLLESHARAPESHAKVHGRTDRRQHSDVAIAHDVGARGGDGAGTSSDASSGRSLAGARSVADGGIVAEPAAGASDRNVSAAAASRHHQSATRARQHHSRLSCRTTPRRNALVVNLCVFIRSRLNNERLRSTLGRFAAGCTHQFATADTSNDITSSTKHRSVVDCCVFP